MQPIGTNPGPKREHVARMPNRQYAYFRDDQITFLMSHNQEKLSAADLTEWRDAFEPSLRGAKIVWPPRCFSYRALRPDEYLPLREGEQEPDKSFSLLVCNMENISPDPLEFLAFIADLSDQRDPDKKLIGETFAGLTLDGVAPNWLTSGASQSGGTGGPGGWPVPFHGNASRVPYKFRDLISKLQEMNIYGDGKDVDVVILDTAPCPHDLVAAYKECKSWHPLIRTLLGPDGKLKVYPATYDENLRMGSTSLNEHDYKMTDHGLFAAGLVHSIVPSATIHLVEVLNPFGVGDLETLAAGLQKVYDLVFPPEPPADPEAPKPRVVVNCSWTLEPPLVPEQRQDPDSQFEELVMKMALEYQKEEVAFALKSICDQFSRRGRQIIAAAGNDWKENRENRNSAPVTRYPAAFLGTFGVGALPKDSKPEANGKHKASSYSNLADIPNNVKRIMTFGGEEGEGQGVLGLYLGEFPGCESQPNCTKWAWWAGTSFATPILTAVIASVLSGPRGPQLTNGEVITILAEQPTGRQPGQPGQMDKVILKPDATEAHEDVMEATQTY